MSVNKSYLPAKDSEDTKRLIAIYQTCPNAELSRLAKEYGYKNASNFCDAMRRRLGATRQGFARRDSNTVDTPLQLHTKDKPQTIAVIGDIQTPYQDPVVVTLVEEILHDVQPDYLVYNGDICDFYQISKFDKSPSRMGEMQDDINIAKAMFRRHKSLLPNTERKLIEGNHEYRLQRFMWNSAPALASLDSLNIEELLGLREYEIGYIPYECGILVNEIFLIIHGEIASIHSGYTAKRSYEKFGGCGLCNHSHRGGSFYKRDRFGTWGWWENFCLCTLTPDWIRNPNWQQGFSLIHFQGKRFWVEQIPIIGKACMYGGKKYEAK